MRPGLRNNRLFITAILVLIDAVILPDLHLMQGFPAVQLTDFLLPFMLFLLYPKIKSSLTMRFPLWLGAFGVYMLVPIVVNGRMLEVNDYFEIFKIFKLILVFLAFYHSASEQFNRFIRISFIGLVVVNFLHFYDVFHFNSLLKYLYGDSIHFQLFGKDSYGQPAVKRMLGTMGNPNTNALLFLFYTVYFIPKKTAITSWSYFFLALFMVFLCQSRTSLVGVGVLLLIIVFFGRMGSALQSTYKIGLVAILYLGAMALATSFFKYTSYSNGMMDGSALYSNSLRSRWETWGILWEMIQTKPFFGHGPYKAYFSRMKLYSENEYLLMWWRYGIFGLCFYLGIYIVPFWHFVKIKITENKFKALLFLGVMLIAALTNNPLSERAISILFLFLVATAWEKSKHNEETVINRK